MMKKKKSNYFTVFLSLVIFLYLLFFVHYSYASWEIQQIIKDNVMQWMSVDIDKNNNSHIAYSGILNGNNILNYANIYNLSWSIQTIDSSVDHVGDYCSLKLDSKGFPHISYFDNTNYNLKYSKWNGISWLTNTVDSNGFVGFDSSIAIDSNDNPHIAYIAYDDYTDQSSVHKYLKYAKWNGSSWDIQTVDTGLGELLSGHYVDIDVDSKNYPHISYYDGEKKYLKYAKWNGSFWVIQIVDSSNSVGYYSSIVVDKNDCPHISYKDSTNYDLKYAKGNGSSWNIQIVDSKDFIGNDTSITLDSHNNPHIVYSDFSNPSNIIKYAKWNGSSWDIQIVDNNGYPGDIAIDSNNCPHIIYESSDFKLKYAKWVNNLTLSWPGETNYTLDGLDSETGISTMTFTYRIKYTHVDNYAPKSGYPKVHIRKGDVEIMGSPFTMSGVDSEDTIYSDGKLYTYSTILSAGTDYIYYFEAYDVVNDTATCVTTKIIDAPDVFSVSFVTCRIKVPQDGKKISGNMVTIMAEITNGEIANVKELLFQYKPDGSENWMDIPPANINHPNPDTTHPYFIHWDVTVLPEGAYNLRVILRDKNNDYIVSKAITVYVDKAKPDVEENVIGEISQKKEKITPAQESTISVGNTKNNSYIEVKIPKGAVTTETIIKVENDVSDPPEIKNFEKIQLFDITLESGQAELQNGVPAQITISYPDISNDGVVDDTTINENDLAIFSYNENQSVWERNNTTKTDKTKKTCTAYIKHFSIYGLFRAVSNNLNDILIYPNPYIPFDGKSDNGKPYFASDSYSGIIFENITQNIKLEIYTVSGECVLDKYIDETAGRYQWDAKNGDGQDVASGIYVAVIKSPLTGQKKIKKIAIVR